MAKYKCRFFLLLTLLLAVPVSAQLRESIALSGEWQFFKGDDEVTAQVEQVTIPHSWNAQDGTSADVYRGEATYKYRFDAPKRTKGKRLFLRFEAVSQEADVYLNGHYLGKHQGAFNAFCFEVTPYVKKRDNELVVKATNALNPDIAPLAGDFTVFGGIYRPVSLLVLPSTCITPLDHASSGIYVQQTQIQDHIATIDVTTKLDGDVAGKENLRVRTSVFDPKGELVACVENRVIKAVGNAADVKQRVVIENPTLWAGVDAPHHYRFFSELLHGKRVVDTLSVYTGLRYFAIDPEKGFFLNGKSHQLRGVNRHQDRPGKGWAISTQDHQEDMELIKEIGANCVRLAHYPHADYFYTLCDREGLLVWAEIPFIEKATESKGFYDNLKLQLVELIRQNFNHPSIFCWSLFNELAHNAPVDLIKELNEIAHQEDPTRITIGATNADGRPHNEITDYMGHNTYPGWYWADPWTMGPSIDWKNQGAGVCISEYGAGASIKHHEQGVTKAPKTDGDYHPEEWQATVHEGNYREVTKRDYVWGTFVWNMFDFASATRTEGDTYGMNDKGLVTYDRQTPKDAFYFYKANWSSEPVLYITSRRHVERTQAETDVKIYSNASRIVLKVNDIVYDEVPGDHGVYVWKGIQLQPGKNTIEVRGEHNGEALTDQCEWILRN